MKKLFNALALARDVVLDTVTTPINAAISYKEIFAKFVYNVSPNSNAFSRASMWGLGGATSAFFITTPFTFPYQMASILVSEPVTATCIFAGSFTLNGLISSGLVKAYNKKLENDSEEFGVSVPDHARIRNYAYEDTVSSYKALMKPQ